MTECIEHMNNDTGFLVVSPGIVIANHFNATTKEEFLKSFDKLWDILEKEGLNKCRGFKCMVGEPICVYKILMVDKPEGN